MARREEWRIYLGGLHLKQIWDGYKYCAERTRHAHNLCIIYVYIQYQNKIIFGYKEYGINNKYDMYAVCKYIHNPYTIYIDIQSSKAMYKYRAYSTKDRYSMYTEYKHIHIARKKYNSVNKYSIDIKYNISNRNDVDTKYKKYIVHIYDSKNLYKGKHYKFFYKKIIKDHFYRKEKKESKQKMKIQKEIETYINNKPKPKNQK